MKWKVRNTKKRNADGTEIGLLPKDRPSTPKDGDTKTEKHFAYLPTKLEDHWCWLESYEEEYVWSTWSEVKREYYGNTEIFHETYIYNVSGWKLKSLSIK